MNYEANFTAAPDTANTTGQSQSSLLSFLRGGRKAAAARSACIGLGSITKLTTSEAYECELSPEVGLGAIQNTFSAVHLAPGSTHSHYMQPNTAIVHLYVMFLHPLLHGSSTLAAYVATKAATSRSNPVRPCMLLLLC